jgi:NitT/TauT family transport system permease protein/putative hydroxymethylpyrimidine transport system permease protein
MYAFALLVVLLGGWEAVVQAEWVDPLLLPAPSSIAQSLVEDRSLLLDDLGATALEAVLGLLAATVAGLAIAVAMHANRPARRTLYPYVVSSQALPIPVVAAPLILILGFGLAPKVVIVALVCFFPITINLFDGLRAVDPEQRKLLRSLDASRTQTLLLLEAPAALPQLFTGLRLAAAVSVIGAVFAEWSGSEKGLGHLVLTSLSSYGSALTFAATVLLFALAMALYGAVALAERRLVTWAPRPDPKDP